MLEGAITTLSNIFGAIAGVNQRNSIRHGQNDNNSTNISNNTGSDNITDLVGSDDLNSADNIKSDNSTFSLNDKKKNSFIAPLQKKTANTLIKSRDSTISIQVTQQKRVWIEDSEIYERIRQIERSGDIDSFYVKENIPEFASLNAVMQHPIACEYFKLYCQSICYRNHFLFKLYRNIEIT